jgi:hypothetical protein
MQPIQKTTLEPEPLLVSAATRRAEIGPRAIEFWDAWVFAEVESELALATWYQAADEGKADAFAAYSAALDREERAAQMLALQLG